VGRDSVFITRCIDMWEIAFPASVVIFGSLMDDGRTGFLEIQFLSMTYGRCEPVLGNACMLHVRAVLIESKAH